MKCSNADSQDADTSAAGHLTQASNTVTPEEDFDNESPDDIEYLAEAPAGLNHVRQSISDGTLENSVMRTVVSTGNDALNILFEAARQNENAEPIAQQIETDVDVSSLIENKDHRKPASLRSPVYSTTRAPGQADRRTSAPNPTLLKAWSTCKFVREGWFTSSEAVFLVDRYVPAYYYSYSYRC